MARRKKETENENDKQFEKTMNEERKERANRHIPSGCRACGGPYPSCMSSCSLFDD